MEHIIKELNSELLQSWNFKFDGSRWNNKYVPLSLQKTESGYLPVLDGAPEMQCITTNSQLLRILSQLLPYYVMQHSEEQCLNQEAEMERVTKLISEYFDFDSELKFSMHLDSAGQGALEPANEYTLTILSGIEASILVTHQHGDEIIVDEIYYSPVSISYKMLKKLFNNDAILTVQIRNNDGTLVPFFGVGLH